ELIAVPVPLQHFITAVNFFGKRSFLDLRRPRSKTHTGAFILYLALFFQQGDDRVSRVLIKLGAVRLFQPTNVPAKLNGGDLHSQAKSKVGNLVLPRESRRFYFAFDPSIAKTAGNQYARYVFQIAVYSFFQRFRINELQVDPAIFARGGMRKRLVNAFVSILQIDVFAHYRYPDPFSRTHHLLDEFAPVRQFRLGRF